MRSLIRRSAVVFFIIAAAASSSCMSRTGLFCESNDKGCCPEGEVDDSDGDCCEAEDMEDGDDCPSDSFAATASSGMTAAEEAEAWARWFAAP